MNGGRISRSRILADATLQALEFVVPERIARCRATSITSVLTTDATVANRRLGIRVDDRSGVTVWRAVGNAVQTAGVSWVASAIRGVTEVGAGANLTMAIPEVELRGGDKVVFFISGAQVGDYLIGGLIQLEIVEEEHHEAA